MITLYSTNPRVSHCIPSGALESNGKEMIEAEHFASQEIADRISDTATRVQRIQEKKKVSNLL